MPLVEISGPAVATGFRFDVVAAVGLLVSAVVVVVFARGCLGRSRASVALAAALFATTALLGCAAGPIEFLAIWQAHWFLAWGLSLFFGDDDVQLWTGRLLISGWIFDSVLIVGAVAIAGNATPERLPVMTSVLAWGFGLSLANRVAAFPVGAHAVWNDRAVRPAISWMLLSCLPPATILGLRLIELLEADPAARLGISQFLAAVAIAAALTSLRQQTAIREMAWRLSAVLAGIAAVSLMVPAWSGRIVWMIAATALVVAGLRLPSAARPRRADSPTNDFLGRLESAASREWNLPNVWKFAVALPVRGASQVTRFVDGFVFEQLPSQLFRKFENAASPIRQAVPGTLGRLLTSLLVLAAFLVLLVLAFR
ncbi:hypothetical protein Pan44_25250 [Caulifigura coniformis]|uniref:Uncharacterized protein n=1 Tax=Caulifigura coniformis TaxID=2527983 RepID=A0A517SEE3_9PLAN|nr:hypothetical protein [Caulifigura coniformis]QDT54492.1 hypothetical protein Pan44_25250 [Caulifigura coniformis]